MSTVKMTVLFEGDVQGVGFRATAHAFAKELGVSATAENLADGSVRVIAEGENLQIEALVQRLQNKFYVTRVGVIYN